jgi:hypothetical protein
MTKTGSAHAKSNEFSYLKAIANIFKSAIFLSGFPLAAFLSKIK